jgi:hypothetical protein
MSESDKSEQREATNAVSIPAKSAQSGGLSEGAGVVGAGEVTTSTPADSAPAGGVGGGFEAGARVGDRAAGGHELSTGGREHERTAAALPPTMPEAVSAPTLDVDREDDEETWTNQPARGQVQAHDQDDFDDEGDLDEDDAGTEVDEPPPVARKQIQNARDVVCEELPYRAARVKSRLRPHLSGTLMIELVPSREKFLFDWRNEEVRVSPLAAPVTLAQNETADENKVDAIISVHEQHLMQIRSGDLNPQLAILADKVRVAGKVAPAVYFFNLIAPRDREL